MQICNYVTRVAGAALVAVLIAPVAVHANDPAISREQIEADWLRQDEIRVKSPVTVNRVAEKMTPGEDAGGAVDGVINGRWGFHTDRENDPWWQVDLGQVVSLERIALFNRCDFATRASWVVVLLSDDGVSFRRVYQHNGQPFFGHSDKKPLIVMLGGKRARYVRLQQPGNEYFHLDEVQVFATDGQQNIALGKSATQSSTSQWSTSTVKIAKAGEAPFLATTRATNLVTDRGLRLADDLDRRGVDVEAHRHTLQRIADTARTGMSADERRALYMLARWTVRRMASDNPLLDFDEILFVKRAPGLFPHVSDQYYGWWSRGGGGICVLSGYKGDRAQIRCLTEQFDEGNFLRPELSYDGKKVLFAYCKYYPDLAAVADKTRKEDLPEDAFYHLFEMNLDGSGVRQLTHGYYDDFDGRYLPNGDIVFLSTRKGTALQVSSHSAAATRSGAQPDSYVRCGGGNHRPVAVFTLHRISSDGSRLQAISAFENFEWTPSLDHDGQILYARWDYIDRFNGHFMSLWSTNPDGTNARLVYGNYTKSPQCIFEARPIPNSHKLVFTATAHHSITGGSLVLLDTSRGLEFDSPLTRLTPEVPFPEAEGWPNSYYGGPWPLSEQHYLCSWSDRPLPPHTLMPANDPRNPGNASGIYLYDAFGNLNLLYRDPRISSTNPIPVRPRRKPPQLPTMVDWAGGQDGTFALHDVYEGLVGLERGSIRRLRIVGVLPKVQPQMNQPVLGVSREDTGKFVLGTVPVEADGSAHFRVPSGVPVFFQAIDQHGLAVQTMRSLTYVQPGQVLSCVGCHESRDSTPSISKTPLALRRGPSKLLAEPSGTWPLRYDQLVQPVLDNHCVTCHQPNSDDAKAARHDLTPNKSYDTLVNYADKDLLELVFEKDYSTVGESPAGRSKLYALLTDTAGHQGVKLDPDSRYRLAVWMDTYAHRQGSFSDEQEEQLRRFRQKMAKLVDERIHEH